LDKVAFQPPSINHSTAQRNHQNITAGNKHLSLIMKSTEVASPSNLNSSDASQIQYLPANATTDAKSIMNVFASARNQNIFPRIDSTYNATAPKAISDVSDDESRKQNASRTKIVAFSDHKFQEMAYTWYQELEQLGYTEHVVVAHDSMAADYFRNRGMRFAVVTESYFSIRTCPSYQNASFLNQKQLYRRSMFGSRWNYILRQLEQGHHILMSDVDNAFMEYVPTQQLEESDVDVYHAYAGTINSFPQKYFRKFGFTVCGGLSWWRNIPSVMDFVRQLVNQCGCQHIDCDCHCDDQVALNQLLFKSDYKIRWNRPRKVKIPKSEKDLDWTNELTGVGKKTGHRVKVWSRYTAFRANIDPHNCPTDNWVAMPLNVRNKTMTRTRWNEACGKSERNQLA
jgi:hypothetical protein